MKKNIAVIHAMLQKSCIASSGKLHLAHTLTRSYRSLLFLLAAGIFLFSCDDTVKFSSKASITSLTLTVGSTDYKVAFADKQGTITVPYSTKLSDGAVVKAVTLSAKATGVKDGEKVTISAAGTITLAVTAENGTTTGIYTVTVKKALPRSEASITSLKLSVAGSDYDVTFTDTQGTVMLPDDTEIPTTVSVTSVQLSDGATGVVMGNDLTVTNNSVTITVTAEDGKTTQTYTVTLVVPQATGSLFTSFTFTTEGNEAMALDAEDRQEIVGIIDNDANTIAFAQQSAYVYLNNLKATFTTSDGATVQVGETPQTSGTTGQDFTLPVSYVVRAQDGTETTTYTVTLAKSTLATIKDDQFRAKLKDLFPDAFTGEKLDITHSDVIQYGKMEVNNSFIASLKGIEFFTALSELVCENNRLTSLDVRKNTALTVLDCNNNSLQSLDVRWNTALTYLECSANSLTSLDLSKNTALVRLYCKDNSFSSLNVSKNTALTTLFCYGNRLTSLDMTGMRSVTGLDIGKGTGENDNPLETLRVNTAVQDDAAIITMKTARGEDLTITTVDNMGMAVCDDYSPLASGGRCGPLSNEAGITSLKLSVAGSDYDATFTATQGNVIVSYGTTIPATVSVASVALSDGATGVVMGDDLTVTNNAVTITVTAADGITTETYTVTLLVGANDEAGITSLKLSVAGSDYDATFTATQGNVIVSYGTTIPATVSVASVALSDGATGVVMGDDLTVTNNAVTITVTAADGITEKTYTVTLSVGANDEAGITSLQLSVSGSDYDATFTATQGSVTVSYGTVIPATVSVASVALSDGATGVVMGDDLTVTNNVVTFTVTASDGITTQTYTVTLSVGANDEAGITTLQLSVSGSTYDIIFENTQGSVIVPYGTAIPATVGIILVALSDGATGVEQGNDLTVTNNAVTYTVTAEDGITEKTYTVTLSVGANDEAGITTLQLSVAGSDYDVTFTDTQGSVIVSYGTVIPATVSVASVALSDGATGVEQGNDLTVTNNAVTFTVTASDGITTKTYTVTLSVGANDEAGITTLQLSVSGSTYDIIFENTQGSVIVPYGTAIPATVGIILVALSDGATGVEQGNDLTVTNNAVTYTVTAEDGITTKTYTVTLSVGANNEAGITSLKLSVSGSDYDATFTDTQGSVIVSYGTVIPATVSVASVALSDGATGVVMGNDLTVTNNAVTITVTAEDGITTKTYTVTLSVGANNEAGITSLKLSVAGSDYDITFTDTQGSVTLPSGTAIPATVSVASVALSDGATGVVMGDDLTVTNNAVTFTVTAEDGTTTNTYTVRLVVSVSITSFTFEVADNEGMALDATDRQQIVGMINQETKTITFAQQSAYVYRDKLKATFGLSEAGAGVQVAGVTQASGVTEQDFTLPVSYVVRDQGGTEITYTVTLLKSTLATIPNDQFRAKLQAFVPGAFTGDQLNIMHINVMNNGNSLNVINQNPKLISLKGVEFFTALTTLECSGNALSSLDVRRNTALKTLSCYSNNIPSLDVSKNTALEQLFCGTNSLSSLDLSQNTALTRLNCGTNTLTSLDVRVNTALTSLSCNSNSLPSLDITENTALMDFNCESNSLTSLDLSRNTALTDLRCKDNTLTSLDLSRNTALTSLRCRNNSLTFLDMTGMRSVLVLSIGTGLGTDNPLLTLRVNTAVQDRTEIITMKTNRGSGLTIITVNNNGDAVCNDYDPSNGGNCNQAP